MLVDGTRDETPSSRTSAGNSSAEAMQEVSCGILPRLSQKSRSCWDALALVLDTETIWKVMTCNMESGEI